MTVPPADPSPPPAGQAPTVFDPSRTSFPAVAPEASSTASPSPSPAITRFGKYEILAELGSGGMGVVYRARDVELGREVALKTLRLPGLADSERVERLRREARTAASLSHPGIVPVHDVGAVDGVPYFAMAYVRGRTLDDLARAGGLGDFRARAALMLAVARAVGHAHERGIVHRDLKPANVLIDEAGGTHVTDFGLAFRPEEAMKLTATGAMLGTPEWMPPEQIEGDRDRVGPASDVYSLGAMLWFLLAGRSPFAGANTTEILGKALTRDPEPLRHIDPRIPADLDTVCRKALDKDPRRRYPTARELADDLERFGRGEAVDARPSTPFTRLGRAVGRRKGLLAAAALALLAGACALWAAGEKDRLRARVLADLRAKAGTVLEAALALRRAGLPAGKAESEYLPRLRAVLEQAERAGVAGAEGQYHLGRLYRALLRFDEAEQAQAVALARDPDYAPSRYERALLLARKVDDRVAELRDDWVRAEGRRLSSEGLFQTAGAAAALKPRTRPPDVELTAGDAEAQRLHAELAAELRRLDGGAGAPLPPAQADCIRGLLRLRTADGAADRQAACALLRRALADDPLLEEAYEGLARAALDSNAFDDAVAAYTAGIEHDRGYAPFWLGRGKTRADRAFSLHASGQDPEPLFRLAEEDFTAAIALVSRDPGPLLQRGALRSEWGRRLIQTGRDAEPKYAEAVADFDAAIALAPKSARLYVGRAHAQNHRAVVRLERGEDPDPWYERAVADADRAVELAPGQPAVWTMRARLRANWGTCCARRGREPWDAYRGAEEDYRRALELDPVSADPWIGRALVRYSWGDEEMGRGKDPRARWNDAEADFRAGLDREPDAAHAWMCLGALQTARARFDETSGARETPWHAEAEKAIGRALEIDPTLADAWTRRATLRLNWALFGYFRGEDPAPRLAGALEDIDKAIEINPRDADGWSKRGMLHGNWGLFLMNNRRDPGEHFTAALADLEHALGLNPAQPEVWRGRGGLRVNWGIWKQTRGEDPQELFATAVTDHDRALALNAKDATLWVGRGLARDTWAAWRAQRGQDATDLWEAAREDFTVALAIHPTHAEARWRRGLVLHALGRWAEAVADFDEARRLDPRSQPKFEREEADARRRLGQEPPPAAQPPWVVAAQKGDAAVTAGDYAAARAAYRDALEQFAFAVRLLSDAERQGLIQQMPDIRRQLLNVRYNAACIESLASVGKASPTAAATVIAPEEAAACRDAAFAHLDAAIELGWNDRRHLEADPDLGPLHGDSRWQGLLERVGK